jgi:hypothetical protein
MYKVSFLNPKGQGVAVVEIDTDSHRKAHKRFMEWAGEHFSKEPIKPLLLGIRRSE